jgi:hydrogenase/urease accessory protein HupE
LIFAILLTLLLSPALAAGHPTLTNGMDVVVHPDRVAVRAKISLAQIDIAHTIDESGVDKIDPAKLKTAIDAHGPYLLAHLRVTADDVPVQGQIASVTPPPGELPWAQIEQLQTVYDIDYPLPKPRPATVRIEQDLLKEFSRLGQPWVAIFVVQARMPHEKEFSQLLLTREEPLEIACEWDAAVATTTAATTTTSPTTFATRPAEVAGGDHGDGGTRMKATSLSVARSFAVHGFEHIISGYDHLLFVAALVLAATQLWDLIKVVTAFAVAHTLTLTLSVLDLVRLPSSIVEPVIAASIVFIALQNVIFPRQSRGAARLAIAFGFGLFHGLGFAGGLLEAMEGMPAINLAVALLAFTLGVEVAHQVLIVPLYFLLKPLRRSAADAPPDVVPRAALSLRLASLAISLAGAFYLVQALRGA